MIPLHHREASDVLEAMRNEEAGLPEFVPFPKIGRLNRPSIITEKIDGTNAQIHITEDGDVIAGSRKRWIYPEKSLDNHGFAGWVAEHRDELVAGLGPGTHYGEWWGQGIARKYGLDEKRFSLFNTERWDAPDRPACCHVVPVLTTAPDLASLAEEVEWALSHLRQFGSQAAPGFMDPEGIVIFHTAKNTLFKITLENDSIPKQFAEAERNAA